MAMADYYLCDACGGKCFCDANLSYDFDNINPTTGMPKLGYTGDMAAICDECAKTHKVLVVTNEKADRIAELERQLAAQQPAQSEDANARRYLWLREGKSKDSGWGGSAPFVMNPSQSRLFAVAKLRGEQLDVAIDMDMLDTKADELHIANEVVERGRLPKGSRASSDDDPYVDALYALAKQELGFTDKQMEAIGKAMQQETDK